MKNPMLTIAFLACIPFAAPSQVVLNAGDTYTYEFTRFDFQGAYSGTPSARVGLEFRASLGFDGTDTFRFEAFENRISEPAIFSTNLTAGAGAPDFTFGRAWQDFQGVFRVTMLSGSAVLPGFFGSVVTTNALYSLKVQVAPRLVAARSSSQIRLSWTTNASGYRLESTDSLPASGWSTVTNSTTVSGGEFVVDVGQVPLRRYFRLRRP